MTTRARGTHTLQGAIVATGAPLPKPQVIAFQYNPSTLRRSLQPQLVGGEENDRSEAVRFTGAPIQQIDLEVMVDSTDQLNAGNATAEELGVLPQLAALELLVYPTSRQISQNQSRLAQGIMEVAPMSAPRTLFVWGTKRVLPVRLNKYSITEELFDRLLHPIRALVSLSMRVLNYSDLDSSNREYHEFMTYQQNLQAMAAKAASDPNPAIGVKPGGL